MMQISKLLLLMLFCLHTVFAQAQTTSGMSNNRSVLAEVEIDANAPTITLKWNSADGAVSYKIYRRIHGTTSWGNPIADNIAAQPAHSYADVNVSVGTVYEYAIVKSTNVEDPFLTSGNVTGYSYITAAIDQPAIHSRGFLYLLVTQLIKDSLPNEIDQLTEDMIADGWNVHIDIVPASDDVADVKQKIVTQHSQVGCDAVYLLGHVHVPYSGIFCEDPAYQYPPDGHTSEAPPSHCGAWPADVYYGVLGGAWTDTKYDTTGARTANKNFANDGKFDNIKLPDEVLISIGRVDFYDLPFFAESEVALTRRYLNKVHAFKMGETATNNKAIIEDNFSGAGEGFSSGAIRDFSAIVGSDNLVFEDVFTQAESEDYLLGYACGPGASTFDNCGGFGNSTKFKTTNAAAFNHIFGSYLGDWDTRNNLMRSSLASQKLGFTCTWSGRPKWVTHPLAQGASFADITKLSQNNFQDYDANSYQNTIHVALLGDPTLRIHTVAPASNLVLNTNGNRNSVELTWTASTENEMDGYFVYRSHTPEGKFKLLNTTPISATTYTDEAPYAGSNYYMVRTAKEVLNASGSYQNLSLGVRAEIKNIDGTPTNVQNYTQAIFKIYPTLAQNSLTLESITLGAEYKLLNAMGQTIQKATITMPKTQIDISRLTAGMYFIQVGTNTYKFFKN